MNLVSLFCFLPHELQVQINPFFLYIEHTVLETKMNRENCHCGSGDFAVDKYHCVVLRPLEIVCGQIFEVWADRIENL